MRKFIFLIAAITLTLQLVGQTQKTFVKSFPNPETSINIEVDGTVEVKEWEQPFVRVLTTVNIDNGNNSVLTTLAKTGRYRLLTKNTVSNTTVYKNEKHDPLKYKGQLITEKIEYIIFVPKYSKVTVVGIENNPIQKNEL